MVNAPSLLSFSVYIVYIFVTRFSLMEKIEILPSGTHDPLSAFVICYAGSGGVFWKNRPSDSLNQRQPKLGIRFLDFVWEN